MDFENLMVGDWIMYLSDKPENAFPIQVTAEMFTDDFVIGSEHIFPSASKDSSGFSSLS